MKLARVGPAHEERPVVVVEGAALDAAPLTADDCRFLETGGLDRLRSALAAGELPVTDIGGQRIGAPIARPGNVWCIGLNYTKHAIETGQEIPEEPVLFLKAPNTGTPAGVALGRPDQPYLRPGDVVELTIDGLGTQRQEVNAA